MGSRDNIQRILSLCEEGDYGLCVPPMKPQVALDELCNYILGEDWCVDMPYSQNQVNTEIVIAIESKLKRG